MSMDVYLNVYLKKMEDKLKLSRYSPKTIKSYLDRVGEYLRAKKNNLEEIYIDFVKKSLLVKVDKGEEIVIRQRADNK